MVASHMTNNFTGNFPSAIQQISTNDDDLGFSSRRMLGHVAHLTKSTPLEIKGLNVSMCTGNTIDEELSKSAKINDAANQYRQKR